MTEGIHQHGGDPPLESSGYFLRNGKTSLPTYPPLEMLPMLRSPLPSGPGRPLLPLKGSPGDPRLSLASLEESCLVPQHCPRLSYCPSSGRSLQPITWPSHTLAAITCSSPGPSPFEMPGLGLRVTGESHPFPFLVTYLPPLATPPVSLSLIPTPDP